MATRIEEPAASAVTDPMVPPIVTAMREGWWGDGALAAVLGRRPESLKSTLGLVETLFTNSGIDPVLLEMLRIQAAEARDDQYGMKIRVKLLEDAVEAKRSEGLTAAETVALQLADRVIRNPHSVDDDFFAVVQEHFTEQEIVALTFAISVFGMASLIAIALHLDTEPDSQYGSGLVYRQDRLKNQ